jgi:hypothetical protein
MNEIARALTPDTLLVFAWRSVVWIAAGGLFTTSALVFIRPSIVHRFIDRFVGAQRIDYLELAIRLIVSLAFVAISPETKLPVLIFWFGAGLATTAIPMMFLHRLQRRHAAWAIAFAKRILPAMGIAGIALASLIIWAIV